jgi:hypothetical protein
VIAFAVTRRSREIGIRMALGAGSQQVVWSVARDVAALVAVGTAVGWRSGSSRVLVMRVAPVQTSGAANIQLYQPDLDPLAMAAIAILQRLWERWRPSCRPPRRAPGSADRVTPRLTWLVAR